MTTPTSGPPASPPQTEVSSEPQPTPPDLQYVSSTQFEHLLELTHEHCLLSGLLHKHPGSSQNHQPITINSVRHSNLDYSSSPPSSTTSTPTSISTSTPPPSASPLSVSLFPSLFPRRLFDEALHAQTTWNEVYANVICDEAWLEEVMRDVVAEDELAGALWAIHVGARGMREARARMTGRAELGIWRSDWMGRRACTTEEQGMRQDDDGDGDEGSRLELKQVEFNTIACAGACHGKRVADMHRLFTDMGVYNLVSPSSSEQPFIYTSANLPQNDTPTNIVTALAHAFTHYTQTFYSSRSPQPKHPLCILFPIQPFNINPFDEVPILNALISTHHVLTFRIEFPLAFSTSTKLDLDTGILTYTPPLPGSVTYEVAVLYLRCGHELHEYKVHGGIGIEARLRMESSRAVLCPSVMGQLAGSKSVQAALTSPRNLKRFVSAEIAEELGRGCVDMVSLASGNGRALVSRLLAGEADAGDWVLKPACAEGGGHNFFGEDVLDNLKKLSASDDELAGYVLMNFIKPHLGVSNVLALATGEVYSGEVVAELGVWGTCLFRGGKGKDGVLKADILSNEIAGWSVRTKKAEVGEMSVIKGYGAFDSVILVGDREFVRRAEENVRLRGELESP